MLPFVFALALAQAGSAPVPASPASAADSVLWIDLGETKVVKLTPDGPQPAAADALIENKSQYSGDVVRFELETMSGMVVLKANNGYGRVLRYQADIYLGDGRHAHTTICPVQAHITGFESWGDPIKRVRLTGLKLMPEGKADMACD